MNPLTTLPIRIVVKKNHSDQWTATSSSTDNKASTCIDGKFAAWNLAKRWYFGKEKHVPDADLERIQISPIPGYNEGNPLCVYQAVFKN
jgi:hypothetical protein